VSVAFGGLALHATCDATLPGFGASVRANLVPTVGHAVVVTPDGWRPMTYDVYLEFL